MADRGRQGKDPSNGAFRDMLREELMTELTRFNELEQTVAHLYFQLEGGYLYSVEEVAKILKRKPDEVRFIIGKILDRLQEKELVHALPRRTQP